MSIYFINDLLFAIPGLGRVISRGVGRVVEGGAMHAATAGLSLFSILFYGCIAAIVLALGAMIKDIISDHQEKSSSKR